MYPVVLDLRGRSCLVIGTGPLADEKVHGLLEAGAVVTHRTSYEESDLDGMMDGLLDGITLAIVCGQPPEIAEAVWQEARRRNILINTVDDPPRCGFIAPAIVRRGDLAIAISTNGKAPALAVRLRQRLESELGDEYGRFLSLAGTVRAPLLASRPDFGERRELWYRLVDSDVLDLLRQGDEEAARSRFSEILGVAP
jgi:precorrin-2 dehydrogenase / sirohydrochlorin ferrochelatase